MNRHDFDLINCLKLLKNALSHLCDHFWYPSREFPYIKKVSIHQESFHDGLQPGASVTGGQYITVSLYISVFIYIYIYIYIYKGRICIEGYMYIYIYIYILF